MLRTAHAGKSPRGYNSGMEFLIAVVVLLIAGAAFAGFAGVGLFAMGESSRKKATARKDEFFERAFDGSELVTFRVNMETPPADVMIHGGHERGYTLTSRTELVEGGMAADLVFTKRQTA